jgi:5'-3' exonuclease
MGIPSYYKRLLDRQPALVTKAHPGAIDWLWMDFNCLMYHCLRSPDLRAFPGTGAGTGTGTGDDALVWEAELLGRIVAYTERVVREVGPKEGVYIAVDGVVPMAKMRQQRLRRFKSSWLAEAGLAEGQVAGVARWDTNALTPGTAFMGRLRRLFEETIARRRLPWVFSSSDEPGEGEHKIMAQWRKGGVRGSRYVVYGLDADLVVLSLLTQDTLHRAGQPIEVWLFREQVEEGAMVRDEKGETQFHWFDVNLLRGQIHIELGSGIVNIQDYCFAMSFLGNDFLPPSLSLKMREDGHEQLMEALRRLRFPLVDLDKADRPICVEGLRVLLAGFADTEEGRVWKTIDRKRLMASRVTEETGLGQTNWALVQGAEDCLLDLGSGRPRPPLSASWRSTYSSKLLGAEPLVAVQKYLQGIQWNWNYYKGDEVCFNWVYPWTLPPLWVDFQAASASASAPLSLPPAPPVVLRSADIRTAEQLCLVLPPASGHLLPGNLHRRFVASAPWLFPASFGFGSVGKRWFWECEPEIPVPTLTEVKAVLAKLH